MLYDVYPVSLGCTTNTETKETELTFLHDVNDFSSDQTVKVVSQEATKLSLAFSKAPVPSQQVQ